MCLCILRRRQTSTLCSGPEGSWQAPPLEWMKTSHTYSKSERMQHGLISELSDPEASEHSGELKAVCTGGRVLCRTRSALPLGNMGPTEGPLLCSVGHQGTCTYQGRGIGIIMVLYLNETWLTEFDIPLTVPGDTCYSACRPAWYGPGRPSGGVSGYAVPAAQCCCVYGKLTSTVVLATDASALRQQASYS